METHTKIAYFFQTLAYLYKNNCYMKHAYITLDPDVAFVYSQAESATKKKANYLVNLWLKDFLKSKKKRRQELFDAMETASKIAQDNGLTPEILEQILNEKENEILLIGKEKGTKYLLQIGR